MGAAAAGGTGGAATRGRRNEKLGRVVGNSMSKTIVVEVMLRSAHPLYRRGISKRRKFYAHDETQQCHVGDVVRIVETRPLSKLKRWRLVEVVRRAAQLPTREEMARAVGEGELRRDTRRPSVSKQAEPVVLVDERSRTAAVPKGHGVPKKGGPAAPEAEPQA